MINPFKNSSISYLLISLLVLFNSCSTGQGRKTIDNTEINGLRFINVYDLPKPFTYRGTTVGGLSGIDYDEKTGIYYVICDDRADENPSRFYKAKITIGEQGISNVAFIDVDTLLDQDGKPYASLREDPYRRIDPEGIRYHSSTGHLICSNEGERTLLNGKPILLNPAITIVDQNGRYIDSFRLPTNTRVNAEEKGIRKNGGFEGLSLDKTGKTLYVSIEEPLYEDGPRAGLGDSTAWIRILKFDVDNRKPISQYAYLLDAIPYPAVPAGAFKINGVPEIMILDEHKMLVMERAFSTGRAPCTIKVYLADLEKASDVSDFSSIQNNPSIVPIMKKLLLNMDSLGMYIDNVEGLTFGPLLPNGHRSLVFVSDDNFSPIQKTQFFLFEVF